MADLSVKYLGLELKNPVIVGASNMVNDIETVKKLEEAGASAVVFKSLFEEQIHYESAELDDELNEYTERHAEMITLFPSVEHAGPKLHLMRLKELKDAVNIPVIASLNCTYEVSWVDYAKLLEEAGADALELNFYAIPGSFDKKASDIEESQVNLLTKVKKAVNIPVSVKISPYYTNVLDFVKKLDNAGADGVVIFNKLFQPEINIETESHHFPYNLSGEGDYRISLRFAGLLAGEVKAGICANTGILKAGDLIKLLLAGADVCQVVSLLYKKGPAEVGNLLIELEKWMDGKGYSSLNEFRGKLSKVKADDPYAFKRAQYVDYLMQSHKAYNPKTLI